MVWIISPGISTRHLSHRLRLVLGLSRAFDEVKRSPQDGACGLVVIRHRETGVECTVSADWLESVGEWRRKKRSCFP